eukprot:1146112-Pelagomonas_calceolata.AAC.1
MLELRVMNAQMPLPNTRLFRVMTPLQTLPSPVNLEGNPFHYTTWLAFEGVARTHGTSTSGRPNSPA